MESGVLNRTPLNHLEFTSEATGIPAAVPLPDELPARPDLRHIPRDILATSTVENLISQNEDLMARLKVSLRRLSTLELENQRLIQEAGEARHRSRLADDQVQIFREKDSVWKEKADEARRERDTIEEELRRDVALLQEKLKFSKTQSREMQGRLNEALAEAFRLKRYQERIRTQVKPHLVQLKDYAQGLEARIAEGEAERARKDGQLQDLREQIFRITQSSKLQIEDMEKRFHDTVRGYEDQIARLERDNESLQQAAKDLELRVDRLRKSEQRCDQLENEVIELRRQREEAATRLEDENRAWIERTETTNRDNARLQIENEDLKHRTMTDYEKIRDLEKARFDLQSQLDSLRFLWQSRSDENERLKATVAALEKLNLDLSKKLQELRSSVSETV